MKSGDDVGPRSISFYVAWGSSIDPDLPESLEPISGMVEAEMLFRHGSVYSVAKSITFGINRRFFGNPLVVASFGDVQSSFLGKPLCGALSLSPGDALSLSFDDEAWISKIKNDHKIEGYAVGYPSSPSSWQVIWDLSDPKEIQNKVNSITKKLKLDLTIGR